MEIEQVAVPAPPLTLAQLKDAIGDPIVLLTGVNKLTGVPTQFTDHDLPPDGLLALLAWLNKNI